MKLPIGEFKNILYQSIMQSLSNQDEELSDHEIKTILYNAIDNLPDLRIQWGKHSRFGRNRILVIYQNRLAILDMNLLIHFTKDVWSNFLKQKKKPLTGLFQIRKDIL